MRYGFCTGFATDPLFKIDSSLEAAVSAWGYDFIEYPIMSIAALSDREFDALADRVSGNSLGCDCAANIFPASVRVIGDTVSYSGMRSYLDIAFRRAQRLGVKKIIFGSAGARKLGDYEKNAAGRQFVECLRILDRYCSEYGMTVLIEAIRRGEADYINTLSEAADFARLVRSEGMENILLMADLFHMMSNGEDPDVLKDNIDIIRHIHICEMNRELPAGSFSDYILAALNILREAGYNESISYESVCPPDIRSGIKALQLLKISL